GIRRVRPLSEERDEEPDLRAAVEPGIARERPRNAPQVEGAQERVGVMVGPDEDSAVAVRPARFVLLCDQLGDLIRLARHRVEGKVLGTHPDPRSAVGARGLELLVYPLRAL